MLPFCTERSVSRSLPSCTGDDRLCNSVAKIYGATCANLSDVNWIATLVEDTGLTRSGVPGQSSDRLYGVEAGHVVNSGGLYQDPRQIALAMIHLGHTLDVHTYVEYGVWTAWTFTLMSSYLARVGSGSTFRARAIDTVSKRISPDTLALWPSFNGSFQIAWAKGEVRKLTGLARGEELVDLCFIDACHDYWCARSDYERFAPYCRYMMFHDVADFEVLAGDPPWGGVVALWAQIVTNIDRKRATEFFSQPGTFPTRYGIGILSPNDKTGNGQTDNWPSSQWKPWQRTGEAWLWDVLCPPKRSRQGDKCERRRVAMAEGTFGGEPRFLNSTLDYGKHKRRS